MELLFAPPEGGNGEGEVLSGMDVYYSAVGGIKNFGKRIRHAACANRRSADLKTQTTAMNRRDAGMNRHKE